MAPLLLSSIPMSFDHLMAALSRFSAFFLALCLGVLQPSFLWAGGGSMDGGGGGTTTQSSDAEIVDAIAWAKTNIIKAPDHETPILGGISDYNFIVNNEYVLTKITNPQSYYSPQERAERKANGTHYWSPSDYLKLSHVYYKSDGPCPSPDHKHAMASVSRFSFGAEICFSLSELRQVPRSGLKAEVFGLWVHELAHLSGYDEEIAVKVQNIIIDHFAEFSNTDGSWIKSEVILHLWKTIYKLKEAREASSTVEKIISFSTAIANYHSALGLMPSRINITLSVAHPEMDTPLSKEMIETVVNFNAVIEQIKKSVDENLFNAQIDQLIAQVTDQRKKMSLYLNGTVDKEDQ